MNTKLGNYVYKVDHYNGEDQDACIVIEPKREIKTMPEGSARFMLIPKAGTPIEKSEEIAKILRENVALIRVILDMDILT